MEKCRNRLECVIEEQESHNAIVDSLRDSRLRSQGSDPIGITHVVHPKTRQLDESIRRADTALNIANKKWIPSQRKLDALKKSVEEAEVASRNAQRHHIKEIDRAVDNRIVDEDREESMRIRTGYYTRNQALPRQSASEFPEFLGMRGGLVLFSDDGMDDADD